MTFDEALAVRGGAVKPMFLKNGRPTNLYRSPHVLTGWELGLRVTVALQLENLPNQPRYSIIVQRAKQAIGPAPRPSEYVLRD